MTANPARVNVESMLRQMQAQPAAAPPQQPEAAEIDARRWRVVSEDGSTTVLGGARGGAHEDAGPSVPRASNQSSIAMPSAAPALVGRPPQKTPPPPTLREALSRSQKAAAGQPVPSFGLGNVLEPATVKRPGPAEVPPPPAARRPGRSVAAPQVSARCRDIDSQLARIIDTWPMLPRTVRAAMLAMIEAVRQEQ